MKAKIDIDQAMLTEFGMSAIQLQQVISYALSNIQHPATGEPIYIKGVSVTLNVGSPGVAKTTSILPITSCAPMPVNYSVED